MKKVLIVANITWNIYNFRLNVIDKFLKEGYEVVVLASIDEYLSYKEMYPQIKHFGIRTFSRNSRNPIQNILLTLELITKYLYLSPDFIILYTTKINIFGGIAARFLNIKSIAVVTGLGFPFIHKGWTRKITIFLYRKTAKFHKKLIFENREDRELFSKLSISNKSQSVSIKGCGVNTDHFSPIEKSRKNDNIVFTFIGRLIFDKGIREFINAAEIIQQKYSNVKFWVLGELDPNNPTTIEKEDLAEWVNNKVIKYLGFKKDVRTTISNSDCIILPSYREAIPRSITEAMSMAKPVITTDTAGCREAVDEGVNGFLVKVKNVDSLVDSIQKMIKIGHKKRLEMGNKGREKALREFDDKKIAKQIFDITIDAVNS